MEKERRRHPRLKAPLDVEYIVQGSDEPQHGRIHDLSGGGAALFLPEEIPPKTLFTNIRFLLPAERNLPSLLIETPASTVHSEPQQEVGGETGSRVGIRFEGLSDKDRRRIQQFVYLRLMMAATQPIRSVAGRRVPFEQSIAVRFDRFDRFVSEVSANISETGMFITTWQPKPSGSVFEFEFTLGDDFTLIEGEAKVVWVRRQGAGPDKPRGMGVQFRRLSEDSRALIRRLVAEHVAGGHTPFQLEAAAPVEEVPVSGAPQGPAAEATADLKAGLEARTGGGRAVGPGQELSHREAESPREMDALREEVERLLAERQEFEKKLQAAVAELARVQEEAQTQEADLRDKFASARSSGADYHARLEAAHAAETWLRRELNTAKDSLTELRSELEQLKGT